jgi:hypothetical protein
MLLVFKSESTDRSEEELNFHSGIGYPSGASYSCRSSACNPALNTESVAWPRRSVQAMTSRLCFLAAALEQRFPEVSDAKIVKDEFHQRKPFNDTVMANYL